MNKLDGIGIYGTVLHYSLIFALVGSAALVFFYFWRNGRLDMDEETKMQMFEQDEYSLGAIKKQDEGEEL
jgi:hypothetical protein